MGSKNSTMSPCSIRKNKTKAELHTYVKTKDRGINNQMVADPVGVGHIQSLPNSLREIPCHINQTNEQFLKKLLWILEHKGDIRKNQLLFDLVQLYFSNSFLMSDLCIALEDCLQKARNRQLILRAAVQLFKEEEGSGANKHDRYARALEELKQFKNTENPFSIFSQILVKVHEQQQSLCEKLSLHNKKIKSKLQMLKVWRAVSGSIFVLVTVSLLICQVLVALAGEIQLAEALGGVAGASFALGETLDSQYKSHHAKLKKDMELISSMKKYAFSELRDLREIQTDVDQIEKQLQSLVWNADFALEGEEKVKLGFEEIEKSMDKFINTLDELSQHSDKCSKDLKEGRLAIQDEINKY